MMIRWLWGSLKTMDKTKEERERRERVEKWKWSIDYKCRVSQRESFHIYLSTHQEPKAKAFPQKFSSLVSFQTFFGLFKENHQPSCIPYLLVHRLYTYTMIIILWTWRKNPWHMTMFLVIAPTTNY